MNHSKIFIRVVILLVGIFFLAGLSQAQDMPYKGTVINLCCMRSPDQEAAMNQLPAFEKRTGIKVNVFYYGWNDLMKSEQMDFAAKAGKYDLVTESTAFTLGPHVAAGWIDSMDKYVADKSLGDPELDDIMKPVLEYSCKKDGKLYALPFSTYGNMFGYRQDLFKDAGIVDGQGNAKAANTLEEFREAAIKTTRDTDGDGKIDVYGTALFASKGHCLIYDIGNYLWTYNSAFLNKDKMRAQFNDKNGKEALRFYADLVLKDKVVPPDSLNYAHAEFTDAMRAGIAASGIFFQEAVGAPMEDPKLSKVAGKFAYSIIPGKKQSDGSIFRVPHTGAFCLAINASAKEENKIPAYLTAKFISSREASRGRLLDGGKPFRYSDFDYPDVIEKHPTIKLFAETQEIGRMMPTIAEWGSFMEILARYYHGALSGEMEFDDAVDTAAKKIDAILAKAHGN